MARFFCVLFHTFIDKLNDRDYHNHELGVPNKGF